MNDRSRPKAAPETTATKLASAAIITPAGDVEATHRAAQLLAEAWGPALEREYRRGYGNGYRVGWLAGQREEHDGWTHALGVCRDAMRRPTHAELLARREADRHCICDKCSSCVRRAAVERRRAAGLPDDYPGEGGAP